MSGKSVLSAGLNNVLSITNFIKLAKDCVFPVFCLNCKKEGVWLCGDCLSQIRVRGENFCPICHKYSASGLPCLECREESFLGLHVAAVKYSENSLIGDIVHNFKYQYAEDVFGIWDKILADYFSVNAMIFSGIDLVVPVPLHGRRLAERGFNQAEYLATAVAGHLNKKTDFTILGRLRYTRIQAKLNKFDRIKNVSGAFVVYKDNEIKNKNILLVDDIFTTGSTMQECAKVLLSAGAQSVSGFSFARG